MIVDAEKGGATPEELFELIGEGRSIKACIEGDCEEGSMYCGQIGGHIKDLKSAKQVVEDVMTEAKSAITSLQAYL